MARVASALRWTGEYGQVRVLIVDDSVPLLVILRKMLLQIGIRGEDILDASDGQKALDVLADAEYRVDAIITDLNMPELDGIELIKRLKADERSKDITVYVMTGEAELVRAKESLTHGAREYIFKPFTPRVLKVLLGGIKPG